MAEDQRNDNPMPAGQLLTRRSLLKAAAASGVGVALASSGRKLGWAQGASASAPNSALAMAKALNPVHFSDLPSTAIEYAKMILASTLACSAFATEINSSRVVRELAKKNGGKAEATIWFDGMKIPVAEAARVNAMYGNASASDDTDIATSAHPGITLVSTGLAMAERTGASGADLLSAMVAGYEAASRIGAALKGGLPVHRALYTAFGGVVTAGKLLSLSDEQMAHAISLVAVSMGGLMMGTDSMAREYMGANAAQYAMHAVLAAAEGYEVQDDLLDAPRGFIAVFGPGKPASLGHPVKEWAILKHLAIKLWPGCHPCSSTTEAAINVARNSGVRPEEIQSILFSGKDVVAIYTSGKNRREQHGRQHELDGFTEAIHSVPYFLSSAIVDKEFTWVHATPEKINNPVVARLMPLVQVDPSPAPVHYQWDWGATVTVVTKSGARYSSTVDAPVGSAPRGIQWSDVDAKYRALMPSSRLPARRMDEILAMIHSFDRVKKASELVALLQR